MFVQLFCCKYVKKQNKRFLNASENDTKASKHGSFKRVFQHFP